jgi:hypothetical protein
MSAKNKNQNTAPMDGIQSVDITSMPVEALAIAISKCIENEGAWKADARAYLASFLELYTKQLENKIKYEINNRQ